MSGTMQESIPRLPGTLTCAVNVRQETGIVGMTLKCFWRSKQSLSASLPYQKRQIRPSYVDNLEQH